jgi:ABC-2 type transport system ATP-binding protein
MILFETRDVSKTFVNHRALDKVSITVPEGSIYGLLGPNGAGKTTLIRIINQITGPDEGEVLIRGRRIQASDTADIGYLPEERGLYKKMRVGEQAVYLAQLKGLSKNEAVKRLKYWFGKFDILTWWNRKVEELSKGMQQKVQFIVTVIHEPHLLIFDEPFSGFDPINTDMLKNEILDLRDKGATIIFSTHNMSSVEEICDRISLINKSKKILEGDINDIRQTYKTNSFELEIQGHDINEEQILNGKFSLLKSDTINGNTLLRVKAKTGATSNDILRAAISGHQVIAFREVLPSMNDIFLKVVGDDSNTNGLNE